MTSLLLGNTPQNSLWDISNKRSHNNLMQRGSIPDFECIFGIRPDEIQKIKKIIFALLT